MKNYLQAQTANLLNELSAALLQLSNDAYSAPSVQLGNSSIGAHVRHVIELFQSLMNGYDDGRLNYDERKRNKKLEENRIAACIALAGIIENADRPDKAIILYNNTDEEVEVSSNYFRELLYNIEHTIHHMALIKIAVRELTTLQLPESFGVAPATIAFRNQCA